MKKLNLSSISPLPHGYAHNDSVYNSPLIDALSLGYTFIEADVHLIKNEIYVSHRRPFFPKKNNTLTKLYLEPLFTFFGKNKDWIFPENQYPIHLVIDIKTDAEATLVCLKNILKPFENMLSYWEKGKLHPRAVTIILSGNRPIQSVLSQKNSFLFLDGRLEDVGKNYPTEVMPLISEEYPKFFGCSFFGKKPKPKQLDFFRKKVSSIHQEGKQFRLWKIPERPEIWEILLQNGLDIISTDKVEKLAHFLQNRN